MTRRHETNNVVPIRPRLYEAKGFVADTIFGRFKSSGTLCGHIDFAVPQAGTYTFSPDEAEAVIIMLKQARTDVLDHSDPLHDPRIIECVAADAQGDA